MTKNAKIKPPSAQQRRPRKTAAPIPALLAAHTPKKALLDDAIVVSPPFTVGRGATCALAVADPKISKNHFCIEKDERGYCLADLGSTNGTFVQGNLVEGTGPLPDRAVIRAGGSVFVFIEDAAALLEPPPSECFGLLGRFHNGALVADILAAAESSKHILLLGPTGAGKELAAKAIAAILGDPGRPLVLTTHNAAHFSSEQEAMVALFGVGARVFANVSARPGLIEEAHEGILFLDEAQQLEAPVQHRLQHVVEENQVSRIGEERYRKVTARVVLAADPQLSDPGLGSDLVAQLRVVRIPPLKERAADIPSIFKHLLENTMSQKGLSSENILPLLSGDHYEAMCLDGFEGANIRGLLDLADRLASRILIGVAPNKAVASMFAERFHESPVVERGALMRRSSYPVLSPTPVLTRPDEVTEVSIPNAHYEQNRDTIIAAYKTFNGNLTEVKYLLQAKGVRCSEQGLRAFIKECAREK